MSGRRPICNTPEVAVPTAASVMVVLRWNNARAVFPLKLIDRVAALILQETLDAGVILHLLFERLAFVFRRSAAPRQALRRWRPPVSGPRRSSSCKFFRYGAEFRLVLGSLFEMGFEFGPQGQ